MIKTLIRPFMISLAADKTIGSPAMYIHPEWNGWNFFGHIFSLVMRSYFCKHAFDGASSDSHPFCTKCGIRK